MPNPPGPSRGEPSSSGAAPGRVSPSTQPRDTLKEGDRRVVADPLYRPMLAGPAPGMFAPASFPPDRLREAQSRVQIVDPGPAWPILHPPGHLAPMSSVDNGLGLAASRTPPKVTYYISKAAIASDNNGGTSPTIRSSNAVDGMVNGVSGPTRCSSPSATWTSADVGHGLNVGGVVRRITGVVPARVVTITTGNGTTTITSAGLFDQDMVGASITGTNIGATRMIVSVTNASSATMNANSGASPGTTDASLGPVARTEGSASGGNTSYSAGNAQAWVLGGPWTTINALVTNTNLGKNVIRGGDTAYIGPGIYRESNTLAICPDNGTLNIIGDVDGAVMGVSGEVRLSYFATTDLWTNSSSIALDFSAGLGCNTSWSNLVVEAAGNGAQALSETSGVHDVSFTDCAFFAGSTSVINLSNLPPRANWTFDRCLFQGFSTLLSLTIASQSVGLDFDINFVVRNCLGISFGGGGITMLGGAGTFKGNGLKVQNSTIVVSGTGISISGTNISGGIQSSVYDSILITGSSALSANNTSQLVEDYNFLFANSPRNQVTVGLHSVDGAQGRAALYFGQERIWGALPRPFGSPMADNVRLAGFGASSTSPAVDMMNRPRPAGVGSYLASGTATSGSATTLTDSTATWPPSGSWNGATVKITGGTGAGQVKHIRQHTATVLTVSEVWVTNPDSTSTYTIYFGNVATMVTGSGAFGTSQIVPTSATYVTSQWVGFTALVVSGTGAGQSSTVSASSASSFTVSPAFTGSFDASTVIKLYRQTDENAVTRTPGAFERHDTALQETTITDAGSVAWKIYGWGDQVLRIPVDTTSTTISVKCSFDTDHGNTTKPQIQLVANGEIGVVAQTVTAVGTAGSGTFETLTFAAFTPTAIGAVQIRMCARSTLPTGRAIFDTVTVA